MLETNLNISESKYEILSLCFDLFLIICVLHPYSVHCEIAYGLDNLFALKYSMKVVLEIDPTVFSILIDPTMF